MMKTEKNWKSIAAKVILHIRIVVERQLNRNKEIGEFERVALSLCGNKFILLFVEDIRKNKKSLCTNLSEFIV